MINIDRYKNIFWQHEQKIKFIIIGIWNSIFGFLAFCILLTLFSKFFKVRYFAYTSAQIIGTILAIINAYILHKYITFRSIVTGRKIIVEFFRFCVTYLFGFLLSLALLPLLVEAAGIDPKVAGAILLPFFAVISYFGHSKFSFKLSMKR